MYPSGFAEGSECPTRPLKVRGRIPTELSGTLLRNGPGRYRLKHQKYQHWFDGLAQLHAFHLHRGEVHYRSSFVRSPDFELTEESGRIPYPGFATDPCRGIFRRLKSLFIMDVTSNPNVSIATLGDRFFALTELPMPIEFDPGTLETTRVAPYSDRLGPGMTTAHPVKEGNSLYNYLLRFGPRTSYVVTEQSNFSERRKLLEIPVSEASYIHSFALTPNYVVLVAYPFRVSPLKLLFRNRPFIENFRWYEQQPTIFYRCCRKTGKVTALEGPPFFCFHHIRAFEKGPDVILDLVGYPDAGVIEDFYLGHLEAGRPVRKGRWNRWRVPPQGEVELLQEGQQPVELPFHVGQSFCGVGAAPDVAFYDRLVHLDYQGNLIAQWHRPGHYPGEPIVVGDYLLSVVLDGEREKSYLLVLRLPDLELVAEAGVEQAIPFGFHGLFSESKRRPS